MTLSTEETDRLEDILELQPTKNGELQERWGMDSGSEVHGYLESSLGEYYYRDENSLIRVSPEGIEALGEDPAEYQADRTIQISALEDGILSVLAGPDERSESVVSVLHSLEAETEREPDVAAVRQALQRLKRGDLVTVEYRSVPTFRCAMAREEMQTELLD